MKIRSNVVNGIRSSLDCKNRVSQIEQYIADGCTLREIQEAFSGSDYTFYLKNCGLRIVIMTYDELRVSIAQAVSTLSLHAARLVALGSRPPSQNDIAQLRVRTEVARAAVGVRSAETKANLFLSPAAKVKLKSGDLISDCLKPLGFKWSGGDIVSEVRTRVTDHVRINTQRGPTSFPFNFSQKFGVR